MLWITLYVVMLTLLIIRIFVIFCIGFIVGLLIITIYSSLSIIKQNYKSAAKILKMARLNQPGNFINPADVAYIYVRGGLLTDAELLLEKDMLSGVQLVHLTMQILVFSNKGEWDKAQKSVTALIALTENDTNLAPQDLESLSEIKKAVDERNAEKLLQSNFYKNYEIALIDNNKRMLIFISGMLVIALILIIFSKQIDALF